jgi:diguanylate cyclase (GGDEF)-like protein
MIAMAVAAQLSGLLDGYLHSPALWGISAFLLVVNVALLGLGHRRPAWVPAVSPWIYLSSATLLLLSQGSAPSGLTMILLIPVLSVALRGSLTQSLVTNAGMVAALALVSAEHHLGWVVGIRVLALWGAMGVTICVSILQLRARLVDEQVDLVREATTDMVTGLANRRGFVESIAVIRGQREFAVLTIDVDGLKAVNDDFGHDAGDELIRSVATACASAARKGDLVARLGGDEFAIFAVGASASDGRLIADRIQEAVSNVVVRGRRARASIGVAAGGPQSQLEDVLSASDAAMYADKRQAKMRALQSA